MQSIVDFLLQYQGVLLTLLPAVPLIGALAALGSLRLPAERQVVAGWTAAGFACAAYLIAALFWRLSAAGPDAGGLNVNAFLYSWLASSMVRAEVSLKLDALSLVMVLVITGVGSLIHLYAVGYMAEDESKPRFFAYFNLFLFFMLVLVLADNMLLMFVGWEGVGLCSYLLIGFWYRHLPNAAAGQKAFVVNRIGDAGLLLGMFLLLGEAGSLNFDQIAARLPDIAPAKVELIALLLLLGAIGKSAQVPLYVWLPDAMAGPTPVSALIHAATMVTAGIYMVCRLSPVYSAAPQVQFAVLAVGAVTALLAATIALAQTDIKKVLAYSTVSQLGYMFMALGAGAYSYAMFHLVTHAFFKGLLFMAAGAVIIGCHHQQDMRRFGGLWDRMWGTFLAFLIGAYAISGLPFGSGAYSKESILWAVYSRPGWTHEVQILGWFSWNEIFWAAGLFTAFLTAFYITRAFVLTFFAQYRGDDAPHEAPATMLVPMGVLIAPAMFYGLSRRHSLLASLAHWTRGDLLVPERELLRDEAFIALEHAAMGAAFAGVIIAALLYTLGRSFMERAAEEIPQRWNPLVRRWWIDELYDCLIVRPLTVFSRGLFAFVDRMVIDGAIEGSGAAALRAGMLISRIQTGRLAQYLMVIVLGLAAGMTAWFVL